MASDASDRFLQVDESDQFLLAVGEAAQPQMDNQLEKNLKALEVDLDTVNAMLVELLKRVSKEEGRGLQTLPEVKKWISKAEEVESKANSLLDKIQTLRSQGVFEVVVDRAALPPLVKKMPPIQLTVSQEKLFQRTWNNLKDENVGTWCLYGMGGIGKTTILNQIKNKVVEAFDLVMFVVVGSEDVELIQDKICERLELLYGLDNKSRKDKASEIHGVLNRKRIVLLFDDLQKKLNLNEIGIPLPSKWNGCKIVFTTRSRELCGVSDADAEVQVKRLSSGEACDLFEKTLGETTLQSHHDIPILTRIIAGNCRGLPLVLSVISKTMACKKMVREWHHAIHVLVSSTAEEDEILPILKLSYDSLPGENIRLCFLYCSLFSKISKQDLVDCWIGEGIVQAEDREVAEIESYGIYAQSVSFILQRSKGLNMVAICPAT